MREREGEIVGCFVLGALFLLGFQLGFRGFFVFFPLFRVFFFIFSLILNYIKWNIILSSFMLTWQNKEYIFFQSSNIFFIIDFFKFSLSLFIVS